MIELKSAAEIAAIARAGAILARLFQTLPEAIRPGTTTAQVDCFVEEFLRSFPGAEPAFKGLYGFPAAACISINHEVVHGIPSHRRTLQGGDIVSVDVGVRLEGWYADSSHTYPVGEIDDGIARLLAVTRDALAHGIAQARPDRRMGDLSHAIQQTAEAAGYNVVRDLVGHGIGRKPHEEPQVPNFGKPGRGLRLQPGLVLAIEPMVTEGGYEVRTLPDRWTVVTADRGRCAHYEHTVAVTEDGPRILTALNS